MWLKCFLPASCKLSPLFVICITALLVAITACLIVFAFPFSFFEVSNDISRDGQVITTEFFQPLWGERSWFYSLDRKTGQLTKYRKDRYERYLPSKSHARLRITSNEPLGTRWIESPNSATAFIMGEKDGASGRSFAIKQSGVAELVGRNLIVVNSTEAALYNLDQPSDEADTLSMRTKGFISYIVIDDATGSVLVPSFSDRGDAHLFRVVNNRLIDVEHWEGHVVVTSGQFDFFKSYVVSVSRDGKNIDYRSIVDGKVLKSLPIPDDLLKLKWESGYSPFRFYGSEGFVVYYNGDKHAMKYFDLENLQEIPSPKGSERLLYWDHENGIGWFKVGRTVVRTSMKNRYEIDQFSIGFDVGPFSLDHDRQAVTFYSRSDVLRWQTRDRLTAVMYDDKAIYPRGVLVSSLIVLAVAFPAHLVTAFLLLRRLFRAKPPGVLVHGPV